MARGRKRVMAMWGLAVLGAVCVVALGLSLFRNEVISSGRGLQFQLSRGQLSVGWNEGVEDPGWSWFSMRISGPPRWLVAADPGWSFGVVGGYDWRAAPGVTRGWFVGVMLWPGVLAGLGGAGLLWHLGRRGARRLKAGLCPACGYCLSGLGAGVSCPECGKRGAAKGGG